jgi:hypothetical protein
MSILSSCDFSFRHNRSRLCSEVHPPLPSHHPTTQPLPLIPLHLKRNSPTLFPTSVLPVPMCVLIYRTHNTRLFLLHKLMRIFRVPNKTILLVCARARTRRGRPYLNIFKNTVLPPYICVHIFMPYNITLPAHMRVHIYRLHSRTVLPVHMFVHVRSLYNKTSSLAYKCLYVHLQ